MCSDPTGRLCRCDPAPWSGPDGEARKIPGPHGSGPTRKSIEMSVVARSKDEVDAADRLDWRLMLPLFAIVSLYAAGIGAVLPVLPFYLRAMGASPLVIGVVLATEASSQSAASPLLGQLSD